MSDFNKKIAFVTGGGDGIGRATSVALSACGAKVIVTDINEKMGKQTVDQIKSMGNEASFFKMDVSVENEVKSITEIVIEENKKIDLVQTQNDSKNSRVEKIVTQSFSKSDNSGK